MQPIFYKNFKWSIVYKNTESLMFYTEANCKSTIFQNVNSSLYMKILDGRLLTFT